MTAIINGRSKPKRRRIDLGLLALEPRWMFDGAAVADAAHAADNHAPDAPAAVTPPRVLVVASNVADGEDLASRFQPTPSPIPGLTQWSI